LALTLTAVVEVDVAVDVDPIVDLDLDHRSRFFDEDSETTQRSTYNVEKGVDVHVAVRVERLATTPRPQRLRTDVPGLASTPLHSDPRCTHRCHRAWF
jgi:hypothetical protein